MTPTLIKTYFPRFASLTDEFIQLYIDQAILSVNVNIWGNKSELGVAYLTAHLLACNSRAESDISGPVTQESVGDLSRSYMQLADSNANEYTSTTYGCEFIRLRKSLPISPLVL